ncbi:hypothetical protein CDL15_Pgr018604 [Punica granatum]|uniref:Uncharacterized protein n=1 Tax=Punica granatum TaxID=22663 RepID=A0A218WYR9_PUNGR|nr:hypothetical protein CDL15_Pgr018604 [Punica granatum]
MKLPAVVQLTLVPGAVDSLELTGFIVGLGFSGGFADEICNMETCWRLSDLLQIRITISFYIRFSFDFGFCIQDDCSNNFSTDADYEMRGPARVAVGCSMASRVPRGPYCLPGSLQGSDSMFNSLIY